MSEKEQPKGGILVSDFDGTVTRRDFYQLVRERWWPKGSRDPWQEYVAGEITHFEALNQFFGAIRTDEAGLRRVAEEMEPDRGLRDAVEQLGQAGWQVVIASAGCEYYIHFLLARAGVSAVLHANPGRFDPTTGLQMSLPRQSPFFSERFGIDKSAVVREALEHEKRVAFAGDGPPDLEPSLLVPGELRFARGWLAQRLSEMGLMYRPFAAWSDIAKVLTG